MYDWAELRHFRYLLAILETQGFRAAAKELHTAQPNLTVQAREFQENASIRLFEKTRRGGIRPTETGIAFMSLARVLLETRDEVVDALIAIERGEIGAVRFGCTPLVDQSLFRSFCGLHKEILPDCPIRPTHADPAQLAEEVISGAVDAAIVTLQNFGTKSFAETVEPAIELADGFPIDEFRASYGSMSIRGVMKYLEAWPTSKRVFLPNGLPPRAGDIFRQPDLARTLRAIGVRLSAERVQVACNLTDYLALPLDRVVALVARLAAREGVAVENSELIGLVPRVSLAAVAARRLGLAGPAPVIPNQLSK